jgi:metal-responsive CopG/Arc/MetJ family transcriptional regulator
MNNRHTSSRRRITVSLEPEIARYLDSVPNRSLVVAEAVREYRARQLEKELEAAYREDREEAAELAAEWAPADAEVEE